MSSIIEQLLEAVPLPKMIKVRQIFSTARLEKIEAELRDQLSQKQLLSRISPGQTVAITAGSRGISDIVRILRELVAWVKEVGGIPFIVPAMGSHGGATAEGQLEMLKALGITEQSVGAPIKSSMEVVQVGVAVNGLPAYIDRYAAEADAIIVVNKIKPHVAFRGKIESGLMKMITIGLGKQKGAAICHGLGPKKMAENITAIARTVLQNTNIIFAVGIIENAYDQTQELAVLGAEEIEKEEPALLLKARKLTPKLFFKDLDALVIKEMGKNISGTGMDTNVIGRYHTEIDKDGSEPNITKIAVLDLTDQSHGNANGVGLADYTTSRLFKKISLEMTYPNSLTTTASLSAKIPMVLDNDLLAIKACIKCSNIPDLSRVRMAMIKNTLELEHIYIAESMLEEALQHAQIEILSDPLELEFVLSSML
ncbi:MAG: DUF2088 domain-containing protein [Peptococcaceae bacterium]|jgi:hypothetical protein|nr:DUF2088 domain-containing protein [Peptococcaceae bacterium]